MEPVSRDFDRAVAQAIGAFQSMGLAHGAGLTLNQVRELRDTLSRYLEVKEVTEIEVEETVPATPEEAYGRAGWSPGGEDLGALLFPLRNHGTP